MTDKINIEEAEAVLARTTYGPKEGGYLREHFPALLAELKELRARNASADERLERMLGSATAEANVLRHLLKAQLAKPDTPADLRAVLERVEELEATSFERIIKRAEYATLSQGTITIEVHGEQIEVYFKHQDGSSEDFIDRPLAAMLKAIEYANMQILCQKTVTTRRDRRAARGGRSPQRGFLNQFYNNPVGIGGHHGRLVDQVGERVAQSARDHRDGRAAAA